MIDLFLAMDPWVIAAFMGASVLLYLTPGADMMFVIASGLAGGARAAVAATSGIILGVCVHVSLAAGGLAVLIAASPLALDVIRYLGAAYLAWLAWSNWRAQGTPASRKGRARLWQAFRRGFLTNLLNPKVILFILAFLPQFVDPSIGPEGQQILILGTLFAIGGFVADALIGLFAGLAAERIGTSGRTMTRISAVIFAGLAARLVWN